MGRLDVAAAVAAWAIPIAALVDSIVPNPYMIWQADVGHSTRVVSNISACMTVADTVRTTLAPRRMDKLIHDDKGTTITNDGATISNDGATISNDGDTIMRLLDIVHPAAKMLVDITKS
ncbi:T-complex protein 1 subunit eta [Hordeum vulgare]|nr:T-complex protein 1 subunit eta [Hordeum vulgare]